MKQENKNQNNTNIFNYIPKKYSSYVFDATTKYQKKYGFDMGTGEHATWNNEADAFKHAYMQAQLSLWAGKHISKTLGDFHEFQGNKTMGQSKEEYNMDNWNNEQGREIAREIIQQYGVLSTIPSQKINDRIAEKVVKRMKEGKLITGLEDPRKFQEQKLQLPFTPTRGIGGVQINGKPLGFAADIDYDSIDKILRETSTPEPQSDLYGYTNPLTGSNHIYTREEVNSMSPEEFVKREKEIGAQTKVFKGTMPTNGDLQREAMSGGGVVYVNSYTRSDGTEVRGYYRSRPRI